MSHRCAGYTLSRDAELARCDREIAQAYQAVMDGTVDLDSALLWWSDFSDERDLLAQE